jgi:glucose-1-phosphate thymidylyltransferase
VTGIYLYDNLVFDFIKTLKPFGRNELEVSEVNNIYLKRGQLEYKILRSRWADAGESIEAYNQAISFARLLVNRNKKLRQN